MRPVLLNLKLSRVFLGPGCCENVDATNPGKASQRFLCDRVVENNGTSAG